MATIELSVATLRDKLTEIETLDAKLDSASGSKTAGKRTVRSEVVNETTDTWKPLADTLAVQLENLEVAELAGVYAGLVSDLETRFSKQVSDWLDAQVESRKVDVVPLSPDEINVLIESARVARREFSALRGILEMYGDTKEEVSHIPDPKRLYTSRGPRGKHALSNYVYSVDGVILPADENSMTGAAKKLGFEIFQGEDGKKVTPASQLKKALAAQGFAKVKTSEDSDDEEYPAQWEYDVLVDGETHTVAGVAKESDEDEGTESE